MVQDLLNSGTDGHNATSRLGSSGTSAGAILNTSSNVSVTSIGSSWFLRLTFKDCNDFVCDEWTFRQYHRCKNGIRAIAFKIIIRDDDSTSPVLSFDEDLKFRAGSFYTDS